MTNNQPTPKAQSVQGIVLLVIITLIWGTTFPLIKHTFTSLSPPALLATRFALAAMPFVPRWRDLNTQLLRDGVILGLILFVSFATQAVALETICANRAAFIASLNAIIVPLLGALLGQRVRQRSFLAAFVAFAGIGVMSWESGTLGIGDLLIFGEAIIYAIYILMLEPATKRHSPESLTAIQLLVIAILSAIWAAPELIEQQKAITQNLSALLYLGLIATAITTWLQAIAQRFASAQETALFYTLEPVFSAGFSFWLLGEKLGVRGIIGAVLVLAAMFLSQSGGEGTEFDSEVELSDPTS